MSGGCAMAQEYLDGALGPEERKLFEGHLSGCPRCRALVASWKKISEASRADARELDAPPEAADLQRLMRKARHRTPRPAPKVRWVLAAATVAAVLVALVFWPRGAQEIFEATAAEARDVALGPDRIALPAGSRVVVLRRDAKHTRIRLDKGTVEAQVSHKTAGQSFVVEAGDVEVSVVGTRFKVIRAEGVRVEVTEGHVKVRSKGETYDVLAGQSLDVGAAKATVAAMQPATPLPQDAGAEEPRPWTPPEAQVERWKATCDVRSLEKAHLWREVARCRKGVGDDAGAARAWEKLIASSSTAEADIARMYLADVASPPEAERAMREYLKRSHGAELDASARLKLAKALLAQHKDARAELERVAGSGTQAAEKARVLLQRPVTGQ